MKLCECGCGIPAPIARQNHSRKGWVKGQPLRYVSGHNPQPRSSLLHYLSRLRAADVPYGHGTHCLLWTGAKNPRTGYGSATHHYKHKNAHRVLYELLVGPLSDGYQLHHECGIKLCCNPQHMRPVTSTEHNRLAPKTVSASKAQEIKKAVGKHKDIAEAFGVSRQMVGAIKQGLHWSERDFAKDGA